MCLRQSARVPKCWYFAISAAFYPQRCSVTAANSVADSDFIARVNAIGAVREKRNSFPTCTPNFYVCTCASRDPYPTRPVLAPRYSSSSVLGGGIVYFEKTTVFKHSDRLKLLWKLLPKCYQVFLDKEKKSGLKTIRLWTMPTGDP